MNIKECKFTKKNLAVAVFDDGTVMLGNANTGKVYKVVDVEPQTYNYDGSKVVKISIDEFKPKRKGVRDYKRGNKNA